MAPTKGQPNKEPSIPAAVRPAYDAIVALTDSFCQEHLNDEYQALCRKLAGVLARKRPSPLLSGKPDSWACGIVRVIAWVELSRRPFPTTPLEDDRHRRGIQGLRIHRGGKDKGDS